jgi:hypothetical protein
MNLDSTVLLAHMRRGREYSATYLAHQLGQPPSFIRELLCELAQDGRVQMSSRSSRIILFRLVENPALDHGQSPDDDPIKPTSVATFPVTRNVGGELTDYEASLVRHRALAMLGRGSR